MKQRRVVTVMVSNGTKWTFSRVEELRIRFGILTIRYENFNEQRFPLTSVLWWDSKYEAVPA